MRYSFVIPCYNVRSFVQGCVNSIVTNFSATNVEGEILLVDDGSTDGTSERLFSLKKGCSRNNLEIRVLHQENAGVGMARNTGILAARGDYICFADADDALVNGAIAVLDKIVSDNKGVDIVHYGSYYVKAIQSHEVSLDVRGVCRYDMEKECDAKEAFGRCVGRMMAWNACYLRKLAQDVLFRPYPNGEDTLFAMECLCRARQVVTVPEKLYQYVANRDDSAVHAKNMRHLQSVLSVAEEQCKILSNWPMRHLVRDTFYAKHLRNTLIGGMWPIAESLGCEGWNTYRRALRNMLVSYPEFFSRLQELSIRVGLVSKPLFYLLNRFPFEVYVKWCACR